MSEDVILKEQLVIYKNQGRFAKIEGGLSVYYEFFPAPAIFWEFEVFNKDDAALEIKTGNATGELAYPFEGHQLIIPKPWSGSPRGDNSPRRSIGFIRHGNAPMVFLGKKDLLGKTFNFWLPNAKFQYYGMFHNFVVKDVSHRAPNSPGGLVLGYDGSVREGFMQTTIAGKIKLSLHTPVEAINWLKSSSSTGTYLTTAGTIEVDAAISIVEAADLLNYISHLLSFANGGFIGPLIVEMTPTSFEKDYPTQYTAYAIDSIERIGGSWLGPESSTTTLLECLPTYQKMIKTPYWGRDFELILIWYFQALQPQGLQIRGKPWPITANALGAVLEKLASIILVEEMGIISESDFKKRNFRFEDKIRRLLKAIGIRDVGPKYETGNPINGSKDSVWWFVEMRNDATHSRSNRTWTESEVSVISENAMQWVEEVLLWRLGYRGKYLDRSRKSWVSIDPRYDLSLRDPSW